MDKRLTCISHNEKGDIWGVSSDYKIWYKKGINGEFTNIEGGLR